MPTISFRCVRNKRKHFTTLWDKLDKWNWDKLHRGYRACPGTRKVLQRGYTTCPMGQGEVSFDLSQSQWDKLCLSHWDKHRLSQSACPTGTGFACPTGLSQWHTEGTGTTLPKSALDQVWGDSFKNQRGLNRISEIPDQKSV